MTPEFLDKITTYTPRFMHDLKITQWQIAGWWGNMAVETGQFRALQEKQPMARVNGKLVPSKTATGGYGWQQWTGPRRKAYFAWCGVNHREPDDDESNYLYSVYEIRTLEPKSLAALRLAKNVPDAALVIQEKYLRPGIPHESARRKYANDAYRIIHAMVTADDTATADISAVVMPPPPADPTAPVAQPRYAEQDLAPFVISSIQKRLIEMGYHQIGIPTGTWGPSTSGAVSALQATANSLGKVKVIEDGHYGPQTADLLDESHGQQYFRKISETRANQSASDLAAVGNPGVTAGRTITWASVATVVASAWAFITYLAQNYDPNAASTLPVAVQGLLNFAPPWVSMILPVVLNLYNTARARGLITQSVARVQQGIDNSGAAPIGVPSLPFGLDKIFGGSR